jgi:hypothetical protein
MSSRTAAANLEVTRREDGQAIPHARRNHRLGLASGAFAGTAMAFLNPELIFAGLIYALTRSPMLVALVTITSKAAILAPQLWASCHLEHRPRKMPSFVFVTALRALSAAALVGTMAWLTRGVSAWSLGLFFVAYFLIHATGGAGHVMFMDMVGRMIPTGRLGSYFAGRSLLGSLLAVVSGLVIIQPVLAHVALPTNYLVLAAIGGALAIVDMTIFSRCREQAGPAAEARTTLGESLRRGVGWLRTHHNYRQYFWLRVAFRVNYLSLAFFIPYGTERLAHGDPKAVAVLGGIMVATMTLTRTLTSPLWGRLADRRGFRACAISGGALFMLAPALALLAPRLPEAYSVTIAGPAAPLDLPLTVYLLGLAAIGAAIQSSVIGNSYFVVRSAPPDRRPSYLAFLNTITSPLTLLPLAAAAMAGRAGMSSVFLLTVTGGGFALLVALRLHSPAARRAA